jgi:hypothetical protein
LGFEAGEPAQRIHEPGAVSGGTLNPCAKNITASDQSICKLEVTIHRFSNNPYIKKILLSIKDSRIYFELKI